MNLKEINLKNLWHSFSDNAYHIYIAVTLLSVILSTFNFQKDIFYRMLLGFIGGYYIVLWWAFHKQSLRHVCELKNYENKAKYAEAIQWIHRSIHCARDAYRYLEACQITDDEDTKLQFEKTRFKQLLTTCLDSYFAAFQLCSGVSCRASIKVIGSGHNSDSDMYVKTLVRDSLSTQNCREYDGREDGQHKILKNTDYKQILERQIDYFFSNNLPLEGQSYENTSLPGGVNSYTEENWPLTYRSALVWPIRYAFCKDDLPEQTSLDKKRDQTLYGFLTIDCSDKDVFDKNYSIQMGAVLADALFPIMQSYRKIASLEQIK
ncbi:hypothetical protein [Candidatus Methylobacter oryzae]|uniref:Uncharacterized protein n=1 Tax=Candidatus Methylobacter oryzae TaxID=2497749 RepID=A0ABY3CCK5_9GAMM|nr:hypothetical protein [Candidatus Methylobacter oryzae]TRW99824.1 hypothetical protein EKO24_006585 [Candidatus Methylobacter oryzae]